MKLWPLLLLALPVSAGLESSLDTSKVCGESVSLPSGECRVSLELLESLHRENQYLQGVTQAAIATLKQERADKTVRCAVLTVK